MANTPSPPLEVEIKLTGGKAALRAAEAVLRREAGRVDWSVDALSTSYYDTVDRRLSKRGVSYRVRRKGRKFLQTVKAASVGVGALVARPEWEMELPNAKPALDLLPDEAKDRLGLILPGELRKLFTVNVDRKKAVVRIPGTDGGWANVEIAVDRGAVVAGRKSDVISEVEIELIDGDPLAIYGLAGHLADAGLSVSRVTKAQRGFQLLDGVPEPLPCKAPRVALAATDSVSDALTRIFEGGIGNVLDNEPACLDGADPEGVHQMRVSLRRMRSVLSVFRAVVPAERAAWPRDELKWLANELGPARDWDVFLAEILGPVAGVGIDAEGMALLTAAAERHRAEGYAQVRAALASPRYTRFILGMSQFTETRGWTAPGQADDKPLPDLTSDILDAAFKKLRRRGKGLAGMDIAARHRVRIELKKFRYTVEFLQGIHPADAVAPFTQALSRMQDKFGHLNDVSVAHALLATLTRERGLTAAERRLTTAAAGQVLGWHARGVHDEEKALLRDWKALVSATPFWTGAGRGE